MANGKVPKSSESGPTIVRMSQKAGLNVSEVKAMQDMFQPCSDKRMT